MFCNKCGSELHDGDMFCSKCGVDIAFSQHHKKIKKQMRKSEATVKALLLALDDIINNDENVKKDQLSDRFLAACKELGVTRIR